MSSWKVVLEWAKGVGCYAMSNNELFEEIWETYFDQLAAYAAVRMTSQIGRGCSGEDIALSSLNSLYQGHVDGRLSIDSPDELWGLLVTIVRRKIIREYRSLGRAKRGGKLIVRGESVFRDSADAENWGIDQIPDTRLSEAEIERIFREWDDLIASLECPKLIATIRLRLEGFKIKAIGEQLNVSSTRIKQRMKIIRDRLKRKLGETSGGEIPV